MKISKGLTIVEIIISFTIAIILIMALYMIVYWGTNVNTINNKIVRVNNIMNFVQQDLLRNTPLYFELQQDGTMRPKDNINNQARLQQFNLNDSIIRNVRLISLQPLKKPDNNDFKNIYVAEIEVEWEHKGTIKRYKDFFLISSYSLKRITAGQNPNENNLSVNLPDNYYWPVMTAVVTPPPPPPPASTIGTDSSPTSALTSTPTTAPSTTPTPTGTGCLEKGTLILVYDKDKVIPKKIEEIKENDHVLSYHRNQFLFLKVEKLHQHEGDFNVVQIKTESGVTFRATSNHPIIIDGKIKKFEQLQIGDLITILKDKQVIHEKICQISKETIKGNVYSIEIEENKYFCLNHFMGSENTFLLIHCGFVKPPKIEGAPSFKEMTSLGFIGTLSFIGVLLLKTILPASAFFYIAYKIS